MSHDGWGGIYSSPLYSNYIRAEAYKQYHLRPSSIFKRKKNYLDVLLMTRETRTGQNSPRTITNLQDILNHLEGLSVFFLYCSWWVEGLPLQGLLLWVPPLLLANRIDLPYGHPHHSYRKWSREYHLHAPSICCALSVPSQLHAGLVLQAFYHLGYRLLSSVLVRRRDPRVPDDLLQSEPNAWVSAVLQHAVLKLLPELQSQRLRSLLYTWSCSL